jgi:hypothetical protein
LALHPLARRDVHVFLALSLATPGKDLSLIALPVGCARLHIVTTECLLLRKSLRRGMHFQAPNYQEVGDFAPAKTEGPTRNN